MKRLLLFLVAVLAAGIGLVHAGDCAGMAAAATSSGAYYTLDQVQVVYVNGKYYYVRDESGSALVFSGWDGFKKLRAGDIVTRIYGKAMIYNGLPELIPEDTLYTRVPGAAPVIPDATAAPTTADLNKVMWFRDVDMNGQSFPSTIENRAGIFAGTSVLFRNLWYTQYEFDASKTYDILGCVGAYNTTIQVNVAEIQEHQEPDELITVGAEMPSTWSGMNLYAWTNDGDQLLGIWPGSAMNVDSMGWAYHTFIGLPGVNYIWNDGSTQTVDLYTDESICQRLMAPQPHVSNPKWTATTVDCGSHASQPSDTTIVGESITMKLLGMSVPAEWNEVRLFSWTDGVDPALSTGYGLALTLDSLGWYSYTFQNLETVDLLFNNGDWGAGNQTVDARVTSDVCYAFGDPNTVENNRYPLISVDCIHPDSITPTPIDTAGTCIVYIYDNITLAVYDSIVVPFGGNAVLPTDRLPEYDGYHFVFWEGLYDGSNILYNVTSDKWAQAKYYINLPEAEPADPVTVRLDPASVPESWENVYVFSWTTGAMDAEWPGALMTRDTTGWLTYTFPAGVQEIDFLFNNGEGNIGNQTVDVDNVSSDYCFRIANPWWPTGYYLVYPTECETQPQPQAEGITVRLMPEEWAGGWGSQINIYAWVSADSVDTPILGEWPGVPMTRDMWFEYTFDTIYHNVNVIFNCGNVQTEDIMNVTENTCFQISTDIGWRNGSYIHEYQIADCSVNPIMYKHVTFMGYHGGVLKMVYVVKGDSVVPPVAPEIEGLVFLGWDKDLSSVMTDMEVHPIYGVPQGDGIKVQFKSPQQFGWEYTKYIYAWIHGEDGVDTPILGEWPGREMTLDTITGWYYYQLPSEYNHFNIVLSAPEGYSQTVDIEGIEDNICLGIASGQYEWYDQMRHYDWELLDCSHNATDYHRVIFADLDYYLVDYRNVLNGDSVRNVPAGPERHGYVFVGWDEPLTNVTTDLVVLPIYEELPATNNLKVHLLPTYGIGWESIYLYAWADDADGGFHEICGAWPGTLVPIDSLGWCTYSFAHDSVVNIIWNDGVSGQGYAHQTRDILNVGSETYYRLYGRDSLMFTLVETLSDETNPANYRTVAYIDIDFDNQLLMMLQQEAGTLIELSPTIPYHEGYVFLHWANAATGAEITSDYVVTEDMVIDEVYERRTYQVFILDWDGHKLAWSYYFPHGGSVNMSTIAQPSREGYEFIGWSDSLQNITSERFSVALYKPTTTGNYTVIFRGMDGQIVDQQQIDLTLPMPEEIEGYMFVGWRVQEGDLSLGTIIVHAVYEWVGPDGMREASGEDHATKELREGKVYIIHPDGKVYSADGKLVETK